MKIKNLLLSLVTLLLAGGILAPFGVSVYLAIKYQEILSGYSEVITSIYKSDPEINFEVTGHFEKGFFNSKAVTTLTMQMPKMPAFNKTFVYEHNIQNGPYILDPKTLSFQGFALARVKTTSNDEPWNKFTKQLAMYDVWYNFSGRANGVYNIPKFATKTLLGDISFGGLTSNFEHDYKFTDGKIQFAAPIVQLKDIANKLMIQNISGNYDFMLQPYISANFDFGIASIMLTSNDSPVFWFKNLAINSEMNEDPVASKIGVTVLADEFYEATSSVPIKNNSIKFEFLNVNQNNYAKIESYLMSLNGQSNQKVSLKEIAQLAEINPIMIFDGVVNFPYGSGKLNFNIKLDQGLAANRNLQNPEAKDLLLNYIVGEGRFVVPVKIVEDIFSMKIEAVVAAEERQRSITHQGKKMPQPMTTDPARREEVVAARVAEEIQVLLDSGLLKKEGEHFSGELSLKSGKLFVNGVEM